MKTVFIVTHTYDADMNSHEQDHVTAGVYLDANKAKQAGIDWLNTKAIASPEEQDQLNRNHKRCIHISSECYRYAIGVMEHAIEDAQEEKAPLSPLLIDDFVNVTIAVHQAGNHDEQVANNIIRLGELAKAS